VIGIALLASAILIGYFDSVSQPGPASDKSAKADTAVSLTIPLPVPATVKTRPAARRPTVKHSNRLAVNSRSRVKPALAKVRKRHPSIARKSHSAVIARRVDSQPAVINNQDHTQASHKPRPAANVKKSNLANRNDARQVATAKDDKVVAMLKSTWRVLKKPFQF
jgi:hypothetical protein